MSEGPDCLHKYIGIGHLGIHGGISSTERLLKRGEGYMVEMLIRPQIS